MLTVIQVDSTFSTSGSEWTVLLWTAINSSDQIISSSNYLCFSNSFVVRLISFDAGAGVVGWLVTGSVYLYGSTWSIIGFVVACSFIGLMPCGVFSKSGERMVTFSTGCPFLFSCPCEKRYPKAFYFFTQGAKFKGKGDLYFRFRRPVFQPGRMDVCSREQLYFSGVGGDFTRCLCVFSSVACVILV